MTGPRAGTPSWRPRCRWRWRRWSSGRRSARRPLRTGPRGCARRCRLDPAGSGRGAGPVPGTVVTVAALHGPKPAALRELLASIAGTLADRLGAAFAPYSMAQVHGTLIGLGGHREESGAVISEQYLAGRGERRVLDFDRVQQLLVDRLTAPLAIRIGGFGPAGPAP